MRWGKRYARRKLESTPHSADVSLGDGRLRAEGRCKVGIKRPRALTTRGPDSIRNVRSATPPERPFGHRLLKSW